MLRAACAEPLEFDEEICTCGTTVLGNCTPDFESDCRELGCVFYSNDVECYCDCDDRCSQLKGICNDYDPDTCNCHLDCTEEDRFACKFQLGCKWSDDGHGNCGCDCDDSTGESGDPDSGSSDPCAGVECGCGKAVYYEAVNWWEESGCYCDCGDCPPSPFRSFEDCSVDCSLMSCNCGTGVANGMYGCKCACGGCPDYGEIARYDDCMPIQSADVDPVDPYGPGFPDLPPYNGVPA